MLGEGIEELLPCENSWNSGLLAVKVGIFFHILVFLVKKVEMISLLNFTSFSKVHARSFASYANTLRLSLLDNFLNVYTVHNL